MGIPFGWQAYDQLSALCQVGAVGRVSPGLVQTRLRITLQRPFPFLSLAGFISLWTPCIEYHARPTEAKRVDSTCPSESLLSDGKLFSLCSRQSSRSSQLLQSIGRRRFRIARRTCSSLSSPFAEWRLGAKAILWGTSDAVRLNRNAKPLPKALARMGR